MRGGVFIENFINIFFVDEMERQEAPIRSSTMMSDGND